MSRFAKKFAAALSTAAVAISSLGIAAPAFAAAHAVGTNVKSADGTVWMIMPANCRRAYTSEGAFLSYGFNSWSQVMDANADDLALAVCPEGFIPPQDGGIIFSDRGTDKGTGYVISNGKKFGFPTEAIFYGQGYTYAQAKWADLSWMTMGGVINDATASHLPGTLVNNNGTVQFIDNDGLRGFPTISVFNGWGYSFGMVVAANTMDKAKTQVSVLGDRTAGLLSPTGGTATPPPSGAFSATVATTNPASATFVAGQAIGDMAHFTVTGNGSITNLKLQRIGVSSDSTLSSVYLYDGVNRISDSASVSSTYITFNDASGLFTLSGSKTISVRSNIAASTSGQTVGVKLIAVNGTDLTSMPSGNLHTIASVSNFATVDFNTTSNPLAATITAQADYTMWQNVVSVGNRYVWMHALKLRQVGSVNNSDLASFKLYIDGIQKGNTIVSLDSQGYINFDLSAAPVKLETGNRTLQVRGDIINGANRNFSFSLRQAPDGFFTDSEVAQAVLATANVSTFSARTSGVQTIDTGSLTIVKRSDSPSGNIVNTASNAVLAKFDVKAYGESMKIESLRLRIDDDDADEMTLRNGALYLDGVQIGSTTAISGDTGTDPDYTEYTFGSSAIIVPGTPRILEVRADIFDNDGTNSVAADDTYQVEIVAGSSNVQRMSSLGYGDYPASVVEAGTLTVATGTLTVANNTSYANNTIVAPKVAYKIGSYNIQASTTEGATITSVVIDFDEVTDALSASGDLNNLYIVMGSYTAPVKSSVTGTANTFSTNVAIAAGQVMALDVYSDVATSATNGDATADTFETSATVSYTTTGSNTSTSATEVDAQTITVGAGTFTTALDGATPLNRVVAGNQTVEAGRFRFTTTNETYYLKEIQVKVASAAVGSVVSSVCLYDSAAPTVLLGSCAPLAQATNTAALVTGLNVMVPANSFKTIIAKFVLNTIGVGAGTSQSNAAATLDSVKYADSQGAETTSTTDRAANELYVYKSIPTVTQTAVSFGGAVNDSPHDVYKFTVTASPQGPVSLKQFKLAMTWTDPGADSTLELESIKLLEDGVDITSSNVSIVDEDGNTAESTLGLVEADGTMVVSWDSALESVIDAGATKTYTVRGTISGFVAEADEINSLVVAFNGDAAHNGTSVYLNDETDQASGQSEIWELFTSAAASSSDGTAANVIWSDNSAAGHVGGGNASSTGDWANAYKILNFDLGTEVFSTVDL